MPGLKPEPDLARPQRVPGAGAVAGSRADQAHPG